LSGLILNYLVNIARLARRPFCGRKTLEITGNPRNTVRVSPAYRVYMAYTENPVVYINQQTSTRFNLDKLTLKKITINGKQKYQNHWRALLLQVNKGEPSA